MIVAQLDTLKGTNSQKKATGVDKLIEAVKDQPGEIAKTVATNPDVAAGAIEQAVTERMNEEYTRTNLGFKKEADKYCLKWLMSILVHLEPLLLKVVQILLWSKPLKVPVM